MNRFLCEKICPWSLGHSFFDLKYSMTAAHDEFLKFHES